jgi:Flp pilus assembly pilin Flp
MSPFDVSIVRLRALTRGQTMAEYAMILATIALIAAALYTNASTILSTLVGTVVGLFH